MPKILESQFRKGGRRRRRRYQRPSNDATTTTMTTTLSSSASMARVTKGESQHTTTSTFEDMNDANHTSFVEAKEKTSKATLNEEGNTDDFIEGIEPVETPGIDDSQPQMNTLDSFSVPNKVLMLDTRFPERSPAAKQVCGYWESLVRDLIVARGVTPQWLVTTRPTITSSSSLELEITSQESLLQLLNDNGGGSSNNYLLFPSSSSFLSPVIFDSATTTTTTTATLKNASSAVPPPKQLTAKSSWKLFEKMVDLLLQEAAAGIMDTGGQNHLAASPLNVMLLTSDLSFWADTNVARHEAGARRLLQQVAKKTRSIDSLRILVLRTGTVGLLGDDTSNDNTNNMASTASVDSSEEDNADNQSSSSAQLIHRHEMAMMQCLYSIRKVFESSRKNELSSSSIDDMPVRCSIDVVEACRPAMTYLASEEWVKPVLGATTHLFLDLPEPVEGMRSSLSLEGTYSVLPGSVHSLAAQALAQDLEWLDQIQLEVLQLVPLAELDARLLFGIPIVIQTGPEDDFDSYKTTELLVQALFATLQERQMALLLQAISNHATGTTKRKKGFFYNIDQTFVLMAAEEESSSYKPSGGSGLLFAYAMDRQVMLQGGRSSSLSAANHSAWLTRANVPLVDYIKRSLECLEVKALNPLDAEEVSSSLMTKDLPVPTVVTNHFVHGNENKSFDTDINTTHEENDNENESEP